MPEQLLPEAQRAGGAGVREWASLAMPDPIDYAEELGSDSDRQSSRAEEQR